jgi:MDMPI C-terminal domain
LTATDTGGSWLVAGDGAARSGRESELRATASDLVLMLYRRLPVPDVDVVGDPVLVAALLSLADTR